MTLLIFENINTERHLTIAHYAMCDVNLFAINILKTELNQELRTVRQYCKITKIFTSLSNETIKFFGSGHL